MPFDSNPSGSVHVTRLALWYLAGDLSRPRPNLGNLACGTDIAELRAPTVVLGMYSMEQLDAGISKPLPSCPKCSIEWDEALLRRQSLPSPADFLTMHKATVPDEAST